MEILEVEYLKPQTRYAPQVVAKCIPSPQMRCQVIVMVIVMMATTVILVIIMGRIVILIVLRGHKHNISIRNCDSFWESNSSTKYDTRNVMLVGNELQTSSVGNHAHTIGDNGNHSQHHQL